MSSKYRCTKCVGSVLLHWVFIGLCFC